MMTHAAAGELALNDQDVLDVEETGDEPLKVDSVSCRSSDMSVTVGVVRDRCWPEPPQRRRAVCTYPRGSVIL
jgi:hypothetical protein